MIPALAYRYTQSFSATGRSLIRQQSYTEEDSL
jgi:hypothetical protein